MPFESSGNALDVLDFIANFDTVPTAYEYIARGGEPLGQGDEVYFRCKIRYGHQLEAMGTIRRVGRHDLTIRLKFPVYADDGKRYTSIRFYCLGDMSLSESAADYARVGLRWFRWQTTFANVFVELLKAADTERTHIQPPTRTTRT
jgi:hypothetical protein